MLSLRCRLYRAGILLLGRAVSFWPPVGGNANDILLRRRLRARPCFLETTKRFGVIVAEPEEYYARKHAGATVAGATVNQHRASVP